MKEKPVIVEANKEMSILRRIEESRKKIHDMINFDKNILFSDETVKMSQYLDKLIVEYIKGSGGERNGEK